MFGMFVVLGAFLVAMTPAALVAAQHEGMPGMQQGAPSANPQLVAACVQSQQQVMMAVDAAHRRLELARQTNQPAALRAAMDDLQSVLSSIRTQLAPCAELQAVAAPTAHDMATMPGTANTAGMANVPGHNMANMPAAPAPAADPHAGHVVPDTAAAAPRPVSAPKPIAAPAANPHAGHVMPAVPATSGARAANGTPSAKPPAGAAGPHAAHTAPSATATAGASQGGAQAVDPICGLKVDPADAPSATYQGHTYHFCSDQHRQSFLKQPAKYVPKEGR